MIHITADAELQAKLSGLEGPAEIRDEHGKVIGYFTPADRPLLSRYNICGREFTYYRGEPMEPVDEILERALQLSSKERGKIVEILIRSLDPPGEDISAEEWEKAWSAEIQRRLDAIDRGEIVMEDWRDVLSRLEKSATGLQAK